MSTTVTPDSNALYVAIEAFLQYILPVNTLVVRGLGTRVPPPSGPHVVMTLLFQKRLATNQDRYNDPNNAPNDGTRAIEQKTRVDVQLDFYGPDAGNWAVMAETLWRDPQGCTLLAPNCQPLHADQARQMPFTTGEVQYLERWTTTAVLQYNPTITVPQQFAGAANVDPILNVDAEYPS